MAGGHWATVRELFEAVCDLPRECWEVRLSELTDDLAIIDEVLPLLRAQTIGLSRVRNRLDSAIAQALAPEFDIGQQLGPWRLVERIAHGGMGTVFRAERADGVYQRTVAIKLLHGLPGQAESERLTFERQVLAGLQLPNIARLYDGGSTPAGHPYLVMEYVAGLSLDRYCERYKLDLRKRLTLFLEICQTVQAAHQQLVLHCDLKPGNVLIRDDGHPVLLDFGVARMLNESHHGRTSGFCTPAYASPELLRGEAVGVASDVYSLGVMLVELLSDSPCSDDWRNQTTRVPPPSANASKALKWVGELRGDLDAIALKACAANASNRYRSVGALMADLRRYRISEPVLARDGGRLYRSRRAFRRNWQALAAASGVVALASVFVLNLLDARRQAEEEAAIAKQISSFLVGTFETADPRKRVEQAGDEMTARQLLDNAAVKVSRELANAPVQLARMRSVLGLAYQNLGVPQQAEQLLQEAVDGLLDARVSRPVDAAAVLADLSTQKTRSGDGKLGLRLAEQAQDLSKRNGSPLLKARLHTAVGLALVNLQRFEDSERELSLALALLSSSPTPEARDVERNVRYEMALMYWRWGKLSLAERNFRELLRGLQGRDLVLRQSVETRLGQVLREQARYAEALPLLQGGLNYAVELYGPQSSFVLLQQEALADLYQDAGDYAAAERHYLVSIALGEQIYGARSVRQSQTLYNYATLKEARGDIAAAERLYRQALDLRRESLGRDSTTSMRAEVGLGLLLIGRGKITEARDLLLHADEGLGKSLPKDAPGRIEAQLAWVEWLVHRGSFEEAARKLDEVEIGRLSTRYRMLFLDAQAALLERSGNAAVALEARRDALQLARSLYGTENPNSALKSIGLAESLLRLNHANLALAELQSTVPILRRHLLPESTQLRKAEGLLLLSKSGAPSAH